MKTDRHSLIALFCLTCSLTLAALSGCDKPDPGPKREDHTSAHTPRYHPDVKRANAVGALASQPGTGASGAVTRPADINFDAGPIGCPVLFVNDDTLTVQDILEPVLDDLKRKAETLSVPAYRNHLFRTVGRQINDQTTMLVIHQEAKEVFSDERVQEAFDKEADRMVKDVINRRFAGSYARYEAHLKSLDLTLDGIKARAKRQAMVMQFLRDRFHPMVGNPTRRELDTYYRTHLDEFTTPAKAELFLIEIPLAKELGKPLVQATPAQIESARSRARERLERAQQELEAGVEFTAVAKRYSKGIRAKSGGDWGEISPAALTGRWAEAAKVLFTLKPDQIGDVVETDEALFIVKCGRHTPACRLTFEEAQEQIINRFAAEDFERQRNVYVQELMTRATIRPHEAFFQAVLAAAPRPAALTAKPSP